MADWAKPTSTSLYVPDFLNEVKGRDTDSATMSETPTTPPTGYVRYNRANNTFEEWSGAAWVVKSPSIAGGGTGATTASAARTNLGLGTLAVQNANAVAITGGTITGMTIINGGDHNGGNFTVVIDDVYNIGSNLLRPGKIYVRSALVIPVGVDKFTTT